MTDEINISAIQDQNSASHAMLRHAKVLSTSAIVSDADTFYTISLARIDDDIESISAFNDLYEQYCGMLGSEIKLDKEFMAAFRADFNIDEDDANDNYWLFVKSIEGLKTCNRAFGQAVNVDRLNLAYIVINKNRPVGTIDFNETLIGQMSAIQCLALITSPEKFI